LRRGGNPSKVCRLRPQRRFEASLERNNIYEILPDEDAEHDGDLRVADSEDYLFSEDRFVAIEVPAALRASLAQKASEP